MPEKLKATITLEGEAGSNQVAISVDFEPAANDPSWKMTAVGTYISFLMDNISEFAAQESKQVVEEDNA